MGAARPGPEAAPRTARDLLDRGRAFLAQKGLEEGRLEAEILVGHALQCTRLELFMQLDRPVERAEIDAARELLVRRAAGEPTAYLCGEREFYGRAFRVSPAVLIPRPETELLVDRAREWAAAREFGEGRPRVLDVGTGSGCLAVTLALELDAASVAAVDISAEALAVARANAESLGADVEFVEGDGFAPFAEGGQAFDLIVSNPPYIRPDERESLSREVREHEPELALFAPAGDPDHWVGRCVRQGLALLAPDGRMLIELGHEQAASLRPKLDQRSLTYRFHKDLGGHERVLEIERPA